MNKRFSFLFALLLLLGTIPVQATNGNRGITFQGVIKDTTNPTSPIFPSSLSNVIVQILGVLSDGNSCILWQEMHTGVQIEKGYLYLVVGKGAKSPLPNLTFDDVFDDKPKTGLTCSNGHTDYTPASTDSRKLRIVVNSLGITADFNMRAAPYAVRADKSADAEKLDGKSADQFLAVNTPAGLTQSAAEAWFSSTVMAELLAGTFAASTAVTATNVTGTVAIANGGTGATTAAAARTNLGLGPLAAMNPTGAADANSYLRGDGSWASLPSAPNLSGDVSGTPGANTVDKIKGTDVNVTGLAAGHFFRFDGGAWINGALTATDVPSLDWSKITSGKPTSLAGYGITDAVSKNGDTMAGALNMDSNNITNAGYILMSPQRALGLGSYSNAQEATLVGSLTAAHKGYTWFNSDDNTIKFWNGSAAQALGLAGSGITSIGGQTGGSQSLAIGSSGNAPAWSSASNTHTLNIPMASTPSVTAGLISKSDYDNFAAKLDAATTFGGDVSGTYNNLTLGTVSISKGGTGQTTASGAFNALSPLTTKGDILVHNGTASTRLIVGVDGKALIADTAAPEGVKWGDVIATDLLSITDTGIVQRNGAGSYSTVTVNSPLVYSAGALGVTVGTATGTLAAGDDARITGALQRSGGTMTGAINMGSNDLTTTGYILMSSQRALGLGAYSNAQETTLIGGLNASHKGYTWFNSDDNTIKFWNGSAAQALGLAGSGITSIGGQTGGSQSLAIGSSGNAPAWSSASNTHTLNIPMASSGGVTAGLISKSDYDTFNAKQPAGSYVTALTGDVTASGPGSATATIATGAVNSAKIQDGSVVKADMDFTGVNTATTNVALVDATGKFTELGCSTNGHLLTWTAAGFVCQAPTPLLPSLANGNIWIGNGSSVATAVTVSGDATLSASGTLTLANSGVTAGTYSKVTVDTKGRVTAATNIGSSDVTTALGYTPVNAAGDTMTGDLTFNATKGIYFKDTSGPEKVYIKAPGTLSASYNLTLPTNVGTNGQVLTTDASGNLYWDNPTASGITALTGDVTASGTGSVAATIAANAVTTGKIADGTILGSDLNFTGVNSSTSGIAIVDSTGKFFNYKCVTVGHVPTWTAAGFACQAPAAGGITSLNGLSGSSQTFATGSSGTDFNISSSSTTHTFNFPNASAANRGLLTSADWTTFNNKLGTSTSFTGDVSGAYNATSVDKIKGRTVSPAAYASGQVLRYDGTDWVNALLNISTDTTGTLPVNKGGTGSTSFTANGVVMAGATSTSPLTSITCATNGGVLEWTGSTFACSKDFLSSGSAGSKVNYVLLTGANAGTGVSVTAAGTDANIDLTLSGKGTGVVQVNDDLTMSATSTLTVGSKYLERVPASSSGSHTITADRNVHLVNLNAATVTITLPTSPAPAGTAYSLTVRVKQDATGGRNIVWNSSSNFKWDLGAPPDPSLTPNAETIFQFLWLGDTATWYGMQVWRED